MQERIRIKKDLISEYSSENTVSYQTRAVAFLDILGWSEAVKISQSDPNMRERLLNVVWYLAARLRDYVETETAQHPSNDEFSQFSDSIIISFPYNQPLDFYRLIRFVTEFQSTMLMEGFPLRGGVTIGEIFHDGPIAFGPAMNRAYELESCIAKSPRVIIDQNFNGVLKKSQKTVPKHWPYTFCIDGEHHETDFLSGYAMATTTSNIIEAKIKYWLHKYADVAPVLEKYTALQSRWNFAKETAERKLELKKKVYERL